MFGQCPWKNPKGKPVHERYFIMLSPPKRNMETTNINLYQPRKMCQNEMYNLHKQYSLHSNKFQPRNSCPTVPNSAQAVWPSNSEKLIQYGPSSSHTCGCTEQTICCCTDNDFFALIFVPSYCFCDFYPCSFLGLVSLPHLAICASSLLAIVFSSLFFSSALTSLIHLCVSKLSYFSFY